MGNLSQNFDSSEFACFCKCGYATPSYKLIDKLQSLRDKWGHPIGIRSGCRCPDHNSSKEVGGARNSYHLNGMGADITPITLILIAKENGQGTGQVMREFHALCKDVFDGNGVIFYPVKKFVHVDVRGYRYLPIPVTS